MIINDLLCKANSCRRNKWHGSRCWAHSVPRPASTASPEEGSPAALGGYVSRSCCITIFMVNWDCEIQPFRPWKVIGPNQQEDEGDTQPASIRAGSTRPG